MTEHDDTDTTPEDGPFQPGDHTVAEVLDHLATADADERARVLDAERADQGRVGIVGKPGAEPPVAGAPSAEDGTGGLEWVPIDLDGNPIPGAVHDPEPRAD